MNLPKLLTQNKAHFKETLGSSFIGKIEITYQELKRLFGQPHFAGSADNKVDVEWAYVINRDKKTVVTIYNYKSNKRATKETDWHIGCRGDAGLVEDWVEAVFNSPMTK